MKILFISDVIYPYTKGGSELRIHKLANYFLKKGCDVEIICGKFWKNKPKESYIHGVPIIKNLYKPLKNGASRRTLIEPMSYTVSLLFDILKRKCDSYDIIEYNQTPVFHFSTLSIIKKIPIAKNSTIVGALHEFWEHYWMKYAGKIAGSIGYSLEQYAIRKLDHIITISYFNKCRLMKHGIKSNKISVIRPGVDYYIIQEVKPYCKEMFDVIYVGRIVGDRNLHILIKSIDVIRRKYGMKIKLAIIGEGPLETFLKKLVQKLDLYNQVTFFGRIEKHEFIYSIMKSSKVFVYPTAPEGGWCIVMLEANAAGLPVITLRKSDIGVGYENVKDGVNGLILNEITPESLADAIIKLLINEELREELSVNSKNFARNYDWNEVAERTLKLYDYLILNKQ
jgi:glycosyltransferase involved in cell wall biosynthesis